MANERDRHIQKIVERAANSKRDDSTTRKRAATSNQRPTRTQQAPPPPSRSGARSEAQSVRRPAPPKRAAAPRHAPKPKAPKKPVNPETYFWYALPMLFFAIFLLISSISYLSSWQSDQDLTSWNNVFDNMDREALNWGGRIGAILSSYIIGRLFGFFGLLLPVVVILGAIKMLHIEKLKLHKSIRSTVILMITGSVAMGHIVGMDVHYFGTGPGGEMGIYVSEWLQTIIGYEGTTLLIVITCIAVIYFVNASWVRRTCKSIIDYFERQRELRAARYAASMEQAKLQAAEAAEKRRSITVPKMNDRYDKQDTERREFPIPVQQDKQPSKIEEQGKQVISSVGSLFKKAVDSVKGVSAHTAPSIPRPVADMTASSSGGEMDSESQTSEQLQNSALDIPRDPNLIELDNGQQGYVVGADADGVVIYYFMDWALMEGYSPTQAAEIAAQGDYYDDQQEQEEEVEFVVEDRGENEEAQIEGAEYQPTDSDYQTAEQEYQVQLQEYQSQEPQSQIYQTFEPQQSEMMVEPVSEQIPFTVNNPMADYVEPQVVQSAPIVQPTARATVQPIVQAAVQPSAITPTQTYPSQPVASLSDAEAEHPTTKVVHFAPSAGDPNFIVEQTVSEQQVDDHLINLTEVYDPTLELRDYQKPPVELLKDHSKKVTVTNEELVENKNRIVETLANFGIEIRSIEATTGPTVTLYEIIPAPGVRISKIKNLEEDIALSLAALGIRIIAPIPGKGTIGIEVPNKNKEVVSMYSVIKSTRFQDSKFDLPIALGKNIQNETVVMDLAKMPHLLVAGATGQGKSVGLNAIITSLLYKKHPSELKFILVDPKKVELTLYSKLEKHFLAKMPDEDKAIITDTQKVIYTLNSVCVEMSDRYDLLEAAKVRNFKEYNEKFTNRRLNPEKGHRYLPYFVVIIDEFADLIMTAGREVETPIARIAQLARAVGIHLIIATQRPSVNIITGVIRANFPARIAFRVATATDSRTILDTGGANQLVGQGDMLVSNGNEIVRVQCAFIDTPEVDMITEHIASQKGYPGAYELPEYVPEGDATTTSSSEDVGKRDSLFEEVARYVVSNQVGSASMIQRKFSIGFNRAGRIVDQLEAAGIVGRSEGSKPRQVLIQDMVTLDIILG